MRILQLLVALALVAGALACGESHSTGTDAAVAMDASVSEPDAVDRCTTDADGDGIADLIESSWPDPDGDGIDSAADPDSDGDGITDADEAGPELCEIRDCDFDGTPDFVDTDSDDDGLGDGEERGAGTDRCDPDTDRDGCPDLAEVRLGGCDDAVLITPTCFATEVTDVSFALADAAERVSLRLALHETGPQLPAEITMEIHPKSGATIEGDAFVGVGAGAILTFELEHRVPEFVGGTYFATLELVDRDGTVLQTRTLVAMVEMCVILI